MVEGFDALVEAARYEEARQLLLANAQVERRGPFKPDLVLPEDAQRLLSAPDSARTEAATGLRGLVFRTASALDNRLRNKRYFFDRIEDRPRVVTQGDSWCSFPFVEPMDLSESLACYCPVYNLAVPGDDLADMVAQETLEELVWTVREFKADATFLSGGGNEMIGDAFPQVLSTTPDGAGIYLDLQKLSATIDQAITRLRRVVETLLEETECERIGFHSYDWPFPRDDSGWLGGPLKLAGIPRAHWARTCGHIIDSFDAALCRLSADLGPRVYHIDLRGIGGQDEALWADEIHLSSKGYAKAAQIVHDRFFGSGECA